MLQAEQGGLAQRQRVVRLGGQSDFWRNAFHDVPSGNSHPIM